MNVRLFGLAAGLAVTFTLAARASEGTAPPQGFFSLFNGQDLAGRHGVPHFDPRKFAAMADEERARQVARWTEDARKHWTAEGGELVDDGHGAYLTTDKVFGDIELLIDYKTVPRADSGIYLRGTPQVQIWDATPGGPSKANGSEKGSGGLFNNGANAPGRDPLVVADRPFGEWNRLRIIQVGARTTVYLNDKLVVDHATMENFWDRSSPLFAQSVIQLQTHGGEIRWRNLFLREIPADKANKILAAARDKTLGAGARPGPLRSACPDATGRCR
jgi:3-keto-disaccharide hydrolase